MDTIIVDFEKCTYIDDQISIWNSYDVCDIILDFNISTESNRENIIKLLDDKEKNIIKFINFSKHDRHKIYKIVSKKPLKFKKELIDNNNSVINIIVTKYSNNFEDYEMSVSNSDETLSYTTYSETSICDSESESESESENDSELDKKIKINKIYYQFRKIQQTQQLINENITKYTNLILMFGLGICLVDTFKLLTTNYITIYFVV